MVDVGFAFGESGPGPYGEVLAFTGPTNVGYTINGNVLFGGYDEATAGGVFVRGAAMGDLMPVPLPGTLALFGLGVAGLAATRRKRLAP